MHDYYIIRMIYLILNTHIKFSSLNVNNLFYKIFFFIKLKDDLQSIQKYVQ